jgi:beta-galactosidase
MKFIKSSKLVLICLVSSLASVVSSQEKNISHYIENEAVISENKLDAHASFTSYGPEEDAMNFDTKNTKFHNNLDGQWKFKWVLSRNRAYYV